MPRYEITVSQEISRTGRFFVEVEAEGSEQDTRDAAEAKALEALEDSAVCASIQWHDGDAHSAPYVLSVEPSSTP